MGGNIPPDVFNVFLEQQRAAEARKARMIARQVLAEMVRQEVAVKPLSWRRRRALIRFAERKGLDAFEARMLVRAAEAGVGIEPGEAEASIAREYLSELDEGSRPWRSVLIVLTISLVNSLILMWIIRAGR